MFCPQCGVINDDSTRYCTACGASLSPSVGDSPQSSQQSAPSPAFPPEQVLPQQSPLDQDIPRQQTRDLPAEEKVYRYKQQSVLVLALVSLVVAAGWVAFVYLALPRFWEWGTDGVIPYSQSSMAPYEDLLAWGMAGVYVVLAVVVTPVMRVFGVREVSLSDREVVFRGRSGREKAVIGRVTAITKLRKGTRIAGLSPQGNKVRRVVGPGVLGKKQYRDFQEELRRRFSGEQESSSG